MGWTEQYKRMLRSLNRIKAADSSTSPEIYIDDAMHFFMDCWHLKDWINHDYSIQRRRRKVIVDQAHSAAVLQTCAALANRAKHLTLRRGNPRRIKRTSDRMIGSMRLSVSNSQQPPRTIVKIFYLIVNNRRHTKVPMIDVANDAVIKWQEILKGHGMKLPTLPKPDDPLAMAVKVVKGTVASGEKVLQ